MTHQQPSKSRSLIGLSVALAAVLAIAACSGSKNEKPLGPRVSVPEAPSVEVSESGYVWKPVRLGAGGYVTGT
jgi:hypothetical protein